MLYKRGRGTFTWFQHCFLSSSIAIPQLNDFKSKLTLHGTNGGTCVVGFVHGSPSSEASRRGSGVNKQMDLDFYLFLTGVRVVPEPSDTSTTNK